jgi:hypothetical protein
MESPQARGFIAAPQPDGRPAAFGVVSVLERNLRETDSAFLGVIGMLDFEGPGVKSINGGRRFRCRRCRPEGGRHHPQSRRPADLRIAWNSRTHSSAANPAPPSRCAFARQSRGDVDVLLGNRPALPNFPGDRLRQMERMGGPISRVRDSFTRVIQTDMRPRPDQIGGPVVDLKGRVIGITMARPTAPARLSCQPPPSSNSSKPSHRIRRSQKSACPGRIDSRWLLEGWPPHAVLRKQGGSLRQPHGAAPLRTQVTSPRCSG